MKFGISQGISHKINDNKNRNIICFIKKYNFIPKNCIVFKYNVQDFKASAAVCENLKYVIDNFYHLMYL